MFKEILPASMYHEKYMEKSEEERACWYWGNPSSHNLTKDGCKQVL